MGTDKKKKQTTKRGQFGLLSVSKWYHLLFSINHSWQQHKLIRKNKERVLMIRSESYRNNMGQNHHASLVCLNIYTDKIKMVGTSNE